VELACTAAGARAGVLVAGSMGPTGLLLEPWGELRPEQVTATYAEQAAALTEAGVDLLLFETFFAIEEAVSAIQGAKQASSLPIVCSFSFDQGTRTMMGHSPTDVATAIAPLGVAAIGANCGKSLEDMEEILKELVPLVAGLPVWCKPNAGLPSGFPPEYTITPEQMGEAAVRFLHLGARVLGGCCGTTPAHVAAIAQAVRGELASAGR
jgi:5-methyltetrahydrofolate--homocysteine methyltransferase